MKSLSQNFLLKSESYRTLSMKYQISEADHVLPSGQICFSGRVLTQNPDPSHNDLVSADTFQISQGQVSPDFQISAAWPALAVCW